MTRNGRDNPLPREALTRAITAARRQAATAAGRYGNHLLEEFQSELVLRTGTAWTSFDHAARCSWTTWLHRHWNYGIRDVIRAACAERSVHRAAFLATYELVEWGDPVRDAGGPDVPVTVADVTSDPRSDFVTPLADREALSAALAGLTPEERAVIEEGTLRGERRQDVMRTLGIDASRLKTLEDSALAKLRAALGPD